MSTDGKGRIRRQGSDGGRDGFIGGDGKVLSEGHGLEHGQEHEHESSAAAPLLVHRQWHVMSTRL